MKTQFPSWHLEEDMQGYFNAWLFLDERQYNSDISEDSVHAEYSIDNAIDKAVSRYDAIVYEVNPNTFDIINVLHDPKY